MPGSGPHDLPDALRNQPEEEMLRKIEDLKRRVIEDLKRLRKIGSSLTKLPAVVGADILGLIEAEKSYGDSWKKRGGVGAFMMFARKWDRIENAVQKTNWDVFEALKADRRPEGIIDDIRDLRRYLALAEAEAIANGWADPDRKTDGPNNSASED